MSVNLTEKQKKFCDEYLFDFNATQAAIRAGYSEKTANRIGSENLSKPDIQKYISDRQKEAQERSDITRDGILEELKKIGFADINMKSLKAKDKIKALGLIAQMLGVDHPIEGEEFEDTSEAERDVFG